MSSYARATVKCGNCRSKVEITKLLSTNAFGSPDLDMRPPEMQRSTMKTWVEECPKCKYVALDISKRPKFDTDYLKSERYLKCDGIEFKNNLSISFYRKAIIEMLTDDMTGAYCDVLCAVWACDDCNDLENAVKCRTYMDSIYSELPKEKREDISFMVRHIDVLRRAGLFDKAVELCNNVSCEEKLIVDIVRFQKEKALQKDCDAYTVDKT